MTTTTIHLKMDGTLKRNFTKTAHTMKRIFTILLLSVFTLTSCTKSNFSNQNVAPTTQFVVNDFPAFKSASRVIGIEDIGKTDWEVGDHLMVTTDSGSATITLSADGVWTPDRSITGLNNNSDIQVTYAPNCELVNNVVTAKAGIQYGTEEYFSTIAQFVDGVVTIAFGDMRRTYSRLRIATMPEATLTVTTTDFTPAGATEVATAAYTLTADKNGNAFLYGVFAEGATVSVKQGDITLKDYTFTAEKNPNGTEPNKSYALDATPVIDGTLGGKTEATEDDLATMVELLKSYIENGHTTIIVTGSQPAKLLMSGYLIPVVSLAFEQLTYAYQDEKIDSYWGAVDLIYQDVTEIVEYEFYCCDVLKSITLPKVTTVGDRGFWACYYLETLTFGSVVTAINDNSGEVFYDLGYKIDGCNLVLNSEQANAETAYQPNIETRTWWDTEWKSITLK